jgi:hypothetical protein
MAASMKMAFFWVVAPCSLVEVYQRFRGACFLHHQGDDGNFYQTTQCNNPEGSHFLSEIVTVFCIQIMLYT